MAKAAEAEREFTLDEAGLKLTDGVQIHLDNLTSLNVINRRDDKYSLVKPVPGFGSTLEWYVSDLLGTSLAGSSEWGVTFDGYEHGGDFDVVASLEPNIVHVEVKSGNPGNISNDELAQFLQRGNWLAPELSILLIDTDADLKRYEIDKRLSKIVNWTENLANPTGNQIDLDQARFSTQPRYSDVGYGMLREYFTNTRKGIDQAIRSCLRHHYVEVRPYAVLGGGLVDYVKGWKQRP